MVMRPAAFVAAVALIAAAAGLGAYLALRGDGAGNTAAADAVMASPTADAVVAVDATEQLVELTVPDPGQAVPAPAPAPDVRAPEPAPEPESPAARQAAPPPPAVPPPAPELEPPPTPRPEPVVEVPTDPEPTVNPDANGPAEGRDVLDGLPEIDGWRRVERSPEPVAEEATAAETDTGDVDSAPIATDSDGWPLARTPAGDAGVGQPEPLVFPPPTDAGDVLLAADSVIGLQIDTYVSSDTAEVEDDVQARVTRDVVVADRVAIPAGTVVMGSVVLVEQAGRFRGTSRLGVRFHTVVFDSGAEAPIITETIFREGESNGRDNAAKVGGGAIAGAILGAIFGGGRGAAIGGAAGAAGGTAAAAAGDAEPATLPTGATVTVRLSRPATVAIEP